MAGRKGRGKRIVLGVLAAVLLVVAGLAIWQKDNIKAAIEFASSSQEEIEEKMQQNQQAIVDVMEKNPEIVVRDLTEEEKQALRDGTLTQEELTELLTQPEQKSEQPAEEKPEEKPAQQPEQQPEQKPEQKPEQTPEQQPVESEYQKQLSATIAKVYVLREEFTIALDNLKNEAVAAYRALPEEERTGSGLTNFAKGFIQKAVALEKECDAKMDAIVGELLTLIEANNGDLSVVDSVVDAYAEEKSLKKAWYMAELEKKGFA